MVKTRNFVRTVTIGLIMIAAAMIFAIPAFADDSDSTELGFVGGDFEKNITIEVGETFVIDVESDPGVNVPESYVFVEDWYVMWDSWMEDDGKYSGAIGGKTYTYTPLKPGTKKIRVHLFKTDSSGTSSVGIGIYNITAVGEAYTGFSPRGIYYVNGERSDYTGLIKGTISVISSSAKWYYVENGAYTTSTGLAKEADGSDNKWYFVKNGVYKKASGIAQKINSTDKKWYYVSDGTYKKATGLAQKADGSVSTWYYVLDGKYAKKTGIAKKADGSSSTWFYVSAGKYVTGVKTVCSKADGSTTKLYYVKNSKFTKATGTVTISGVKYKVTNGVAVKA